MKVSGLDARVVIVTGGAGGIGAATCEVFAAQGARVVVADIDGDRATETARVIEAGGGSAIGVAADIGDETSVESMFETAMTAFGPVDVLHNNAFPINLAHQDGAVGDVPVDMWTQVMASGLTGPFLCSKLAIPMMVEQGGGSIIFTSSIQALYGDRGVSAYAAAKIGLLSLTKSIAAQYGRLGIRCNAVCPGFIPSSRVVGAARERLLRHQLLGREGLPADIANMVVFLASQEASFVTGQVLAVDGGTTAHSPVWAESGSPT